MDVEEFKKYIRSQSPASIAEELLMKPTVHALSCENEYQAYKQIIKAEHPNSFHIAVVGSGGWKFSLNPYNNLREFRDKSDIDIAVICAESFLNTWDAMRDHHRNNYYSLNNDSRTALKRAGENVYAGFITPKWINSRSSAVRREYDKRTNNYSNSAVKFKAVNMMYFRNMDETIDYYVRGIRIAAR
ncbi:hypothetical protein [Pseudomonas fragi]|uniref:hypothetical protein n=1 Tax=Pseudomonas fragi TaxID=296 RepID=UPI002D7A0C30|nr:hypothetical protein [Pseudomonas fragi]WRT62615.1 hypothetical protein VK847_09955 [Pseudomonas fragi]